MTRAPFRSTLPFAALALAVACQGPAPQLSGARREPDAAIRASLPPPPALDAGALDGSDGGDGGDSRDADAVAEAAPVRSDPMAAHKETRDELLALFAIREMTDRETAQLRPDAFLKATFGTEGPTRMNQGNKAIALHATSREECLAGLEGIVLQTPEQRATCGADNMVPVARAGKSPAYCIDVFEFPNRACELPIVWSSPSAAANVCKLQGKRLCTQGEWQLACRGDPEGGKDRRYAYGDSLDLEVCNTHRPHRQRCDPRGPKTAWGTCTTDTEPSGAFPQCRSRFGVFDQHGNVAEIMTRKDADGKVVSQLKGSAWFYAEVAREPDRPPPKATLYKTIAHADHCNFDPRWHVEPIETAVHVNYHLGFRCCKGL